MGSGPYNSPWGARGQTPTPPLWGTAWGVGAAITGLGALSFKTRGFPPHPLRARAIVYGPALQ
eukprot:gene21135-biopygen19166